jgi:hypothetical protein
MRLLCLLFLLGAICSPVLAQQGFGAHLGVTTDEAKLAGAPGDYEAVATVPAGQAVSTDICFKDGAWCAVTWGDVSGYIDASKVEIEYRGQNMLLEDAYSLYWRDLTALPLWLEGDSFSISNEGAGLGDYLASTYGRNVVGTGVGGSTLEETFARVTSLAQENANRVLILWDGSSNGYSDIFEDIRRYLAISGARGRAIILPPVRRASDPPELRAAITSLQESIMRRFEGRTIDVQALLASAARTPEDEADVAAGVVPSSYMLPDKAHLNSDGVALVGAAVEELLASLGW